MLLCTTTAFSQKLKESEVPSVVKSSFSGQFPSARNVKWSKESENEFEAEFKSSQGEQSANFDVSGKWLVTETEVSERSLPEPVKQALKREFSTYEIEETEKVETFEGKTFYEIKLELGEKMVVAEIAPDGTVQSAREEKEDNEG